MKKTLIDLKTRVESFVKEISLNEEQEKEFKSIIEVSGNFKTGALFIEEKTFRDYTKDLLAHKFLYSKNKDGELTQKIKVFILDFFNLLYPEVNRESIQIKIEILESSIKVIELTDLTKSLFDTVIKTNIL